jgi:hypothetical protein
VQQDRGLSDDPALFALERDRVEAVVDVLVERRGDGLEVPGFTAVERL